MLEARAIYAGYGQTPTIRGASLTLHPHRFIAVGGPNGAGKTSLLLALTGGLPLMSGEVFLGSRSISSYPRSELAAAICFLPQKTAVSFPYSALQVVLMGRHPYAGWSILDQADDVLLAHASLQRLDAADLAHRRFTELSGGEQQVVLLARCFAQASPIMVLDEPATALDLMRQATVMRELRTFCAAGGTVLATFHDLSLAAQVSDELLLLSSGQIVASGSPGAVLNNSDLSDIYGVPIRTATDTLGRPWVGL